MANYSKTTGNHVFLSVLVFRNEGIPFAIEQYQDKNMGTSYFIQQISWNNFFSHSLQTEVKEYL